MALPVLPATASQPEDALNVTEGPIFLGQLPELIPGIEFAVAGDPSIIVDDDGYRMYYACYGFAENGTEACLATSTDGLHWQDAEIGSAATFNLGQVLFGTPGSWDMAHETPYAVQRTEGTYLYFTGYDQTSDGFFGTDRAPIGLSVAADGLHFGATQEVLSPTSGGLDDHGMTSPTVFPWGDGWGMTYTGWCLESPEVCPRLDDGLYVAQMGATSLDGVTWTKLGTNLVPDDTLPPYALGGIAESHVFQVPDGRWAMLHMGLTPDSHHVVGIGMAATPFGPWRFREEPLLTPENIGEMGWPAGGVSAVAPHGLIEDGKLRIWFAGEAAGYRIGYAEGDWPLSGTTFVPMPPTDVTVASHDDRATLTWAAPADNGGSEINRYVIEYSVDNGAWVRSTIDATEPTAVIDDLPRASDITFRVVAVNGEGESEASSPASSITVPPLPAAKPGRMVLSDDSSHDGIRDGSYVVTANLWWGQNGTEFRLYENGTLIHTELLDDATPSHQTVSVPVTGRADGSYAYTCELENGRGVTDCRAHTVRVTDAAPAKPAISAPSRDADGTFNVTADLWWGTNATAWTLTDNGMEIASGALTVATPNAQHVEIPLTGRAPGIHQYVVIFSNEFGETSSRTATVRVG